MVAKPRGLPGVLVRPFPAVIIALLALAGCVTAGAGGGGSGNVITEEAILEVADSAQDAYEVINRTRPQWLRSRGVSSFSDPSPTTPVVYLDGVRHGDLDSLRGLNSNSLRQIEYLSQTDAQIRFGINHPGGAILVTTRR